MTQESNVKFQTEREIDLEIPDTESYVRIQTEREIEVVMD